MLTTTCAFPYHLLLFVVYNNRFPRHGRNFEGSRLSIQASGMMFLAGLHVLTSFVQWAKNPPSSVWRYDRRASPPHRSSRDRERSRSPRRRPERDDREKDRDGERDTKDRDKDRERRRRSRTPERRKSLTPERRREDRARTPPPLERDDVKKDEDRAMTPPYEH